MKKRSTIILIVLIVGLISVIVYQQIEINNLSYCSGAWMEMYWDEVDKTIHLESVLEARKLQYGG